jgi:hypothetical protein
MVDVNIEPKRRDVDNLRDVLTELQKRTGRDAFQSVMLASVRLCESGRSYCKPGRKTREVVSNPFFKMRKRERALFDMSDPRQAIKLQSRYMIAIDTQAKGRRWWYTNDRNDPKKRIPRHGLAKKVWNVLAAKAASTKGQTFNRGDYWTFGAFRSPDVSVSKVHAALSYLEDAYKNLQETIITKATKKLEYDAGLKVKESCDKANAGKAA